MYVWADLEKELIVVGEGASGGGNSWGVWDGHTHTAIFNMDTTRTYYTVQGTVLSVMWQPGREGSGGDGYVYM